MEVLKHIQYKNVEVKVVRIEPHTEEIIVDNEKTTIGQTSIAWAKKADHSQTAKYEAKNVTFETKAGNINFGISITRSR